MVVVAVVVVVIVVMVVAVVGSSSSSSSSSTCSSSENVGNIIIGNTTNQKVSGFSPSCITYNNVNIVVQKDRTWGWRQKRLGHIGWIVRNQIE